MASDDDTGLTPDGRQVAYPVCCGQRTRLSALYGWQCVQCGAEYPFAAAPDPEDW